MCKRVEKTKVKAPEPKSSLPQSVPYDLGELKGRTCSSCACYFESANPENPTQFQGFCRRAPPDLVKTSVLQPRVDLQGNPILDRNKQPVLQREEVQGFLFKPVQRSGTCFDGYRSNGTLPGERMHEALAVKFLPVVLEMLRGNHKAAEKMGRAILDHLIEQSPLQSDSTDNPTAN